MIYSEIKYQPERTRTFLGSPSIVRLPDGVLLATHDYFGPGCPKNHEGEEGLTSVYRSEDDGHSWQNATHLMNAFWSGLFCHGDSVYLLGCSQQYGSIVIRRSDDGGFTWTHPADEKTGLLFRGGPYHDPPNYHCAPVPVVVHGGRIYRAFEDCTPCVWGTGFQACVISVPEDADFLDAGVWTMSNKLPFDPGCLPDALKGAERPGWLEGNVVVSPEGAVWNILRFNSRPHVDKAAMVSVCDDGRRIAFDPHTGFIDFPGGMTKFSIRRDPVSGRYRSSEKDLEFHDDGRWTMDDGKSHDSHHRGVQKSEYSSEALYLSLVNNNTDPAEPAQRNVLSLYASDDLRTWRFVVRLMEDDTGLSHEDSVRLTGFQYVDWQFDGRDIIYVVRTAYRGAVRYHDSNRILYRVLRDYAQVVGKG